LHPQKGAIMENKISFKMKQCGSDNQLCAISVYRTFMLNNKGKEPKPSYIDTMHPMSMDELRVLKNFLQEFLIQNDGY
jgi:hypothetical protein